MRSHRQFAIFAICERLRGGGIAICVANIKALEMPVPLEPDYQNGRSVMAVKTESYQHITIFLSVPRLPSAGWHADCF